MPDAVRLHLDGRTNDRADLVGLFLCPASRLPELITDLIKVKPPRPVELSLVIDTGLGGVPKALSIVESRAELLALRMVEMPAPSDVDEVWLERVSEFVPEDVIRVIEPRRGGAGWLDGIQRVIEHGSWPKIRCGGLSEQNFPSIDEVAEFLSVINAGNSSFKATAGLHNAVRHTDAETGFTHHGFLNLLIATARLIAGGAADESVHEALDVDRRQGAGRGGAGADRARGAGGARRVRLLRLVLADRPGDGPRGAGPAVSWIRDPAFAKDEPFGPQTLPYGVVDAG